MNIAFNLEQLKIFYEVAKSGNITRASEKLFISQPAISMVIKNLEEEMEAKLFIRNKKGVVLTEIGQKLFEEVEKGLEHFSLLKPILDKEKGALEGKLLIGCGSNITKKFLIPSLNKFLSIYPNVEITQVKGVRDELITRLSRGEIDLLITQKTGKEENLVFEQLGEMEYVFVKSPTFKGKRFIKFSEGSYMNGLFNKFIDKKGFSNVPIIKVSGYNLAIEFASAGLGITLAPLFLVENKIKEGKLEVIYKDYPLPKAQVGYYYNPSLISNIAKEFIRSLKS